MGTNSIHRLHPFRRTTTAVGVIAGALLALGALAAPVHAQDLTVEKVVSQVNGEAPPATEVISVSPGDSVSYGISVASVADLGGTDITIRDVFEADVLEFQDASSGGCTASGGEVTCTLTLDDAGSTEVELTFQVLEVENCQRLVNTAEVTAGEDETASAEAEIEACPAGGGGQGNGDEGGNGQGNGQGDGGSGQPNTAMPGPSGEDGRPSPATVVGLVLILLAGLAVRRLHAVEAD